MSIADFFRLLFHRTGPRRQEAVKLAQKLGEANDRLAVAKAINTIAVEQLLQTVIDAVRGDERGRPR